MRKHAHQPSPHTDHNGVSICRCGSLETSTVHYPQGRTDEHQNEHRRRTGENEDA